MIGCEMGLFISVFLKHFELRARLGHSLYLAAVSFRNDYKYVI